jgi:uncharacterized protein
MTLLIKKALITGATSGIGLSYCHALAAQKTDLVIVARHIKALDDLASTLSKQYGIEVVPVALDLGEANAAQTLWSMLQKQKIVIDCLINNAGYGETAQFLDLSWSDHERMIRAMLTTLTELCYLFLPQLKRHQQAYIINVSSISGLIHFSIKKRMHRMLYPPIKNYVAHFSEQLALAYREDGIVVQALCPGLTVSQFHQRTGESDLYSRMPQWMWSSSDEVVSKSLSSLKPNKKTVLIPGWHNKLLVLLSRLNYLLPF